MIVTILTWETGLRQLLPFVGSLVIALIGHPFSTTDYDYFPKVYLETPPCPG